MSLFLVGGLVFAAAAQTEPKTTHTTMQTTPKKETKMKSKPTTTVPQKVNNVVRPKHKKYKGHKTKSKTSK